MPHEPAPLASEPLPSAATPSPVAPGPDSACPDDAGEPGGSPAPDWSCPRCRHEPDCGELGASECFRCARCGECWRLDDDVAWLARPDFQRRRRRRLLKFVLGYCVAFAALGFLSIGTDISEAYVVFASLGTLATIVLTAVLLGQPQHRWPAVLTLFVGLGVAILTLGLEMAAPASPGADLGYGLAALAIVAGTLLAHRTVRQARNLSPR